MKKKEYNERNNTEDQEKDTDVDMQYVSKV